MSERYHDIPWRRQEDLVEIGDHRPLVRDRDVESLVTAGTHKSTEVLFFDFGQVVVVAELIVHDFGLAVIQPFADQTIVRHFLIP